MKFAGKLAFELYGCFITWETIVRDNMLVVLSGGLRDPGSVWLVKVDIEKTSSDTVSIIPFKTIH